MDPALHRTGSVVTRQIEAHTNFGAKIALDATCLRALPFSAESQISEIAGADGLAWEWFGPTWSLAVEEQFYLVSPVVVRLLSTWLYRFLSAVVIADACCGSRCSRLRWWVPRPCLPPHACRADTFAVGMLAAAGVNLDFGDWLSAHQSWLYDSLACCWREFVVIGDGRRTTNHFPMQIAGYTWVSYFRCRAAFRPANIVRSASLRLCA